jgi:hypothetical protein
MVEPEGGHHFLQLAWSVDGAEDARLHRLHHNDARFAPSLFLRVLIAFRGLNRRFELIEQLHRRQPQRRQRIDPFLKVRGVRDRRGVKLAIDVRCHPCALDFIYVARAGSEREPVKRVDRTLIRRDRNSICLLDSHDTQYASKLLLNQISY